MLIVLLLLTYAVGNEESNKRPFSGDNLSLSNKKAIPSALQQVLEDSSDTRDTRAEMVLLRHFLINHEKIRHFEPLNFALLVNKFLEMVNLVDHYSFEYLEILWPYLHLNCGGPPIEFQTNFNNFLDSVVPQGIKYLQTPPTGSSFDFRLYVAYRYLNTFQIDYSNIDRLVFKIGDWLHFLRLQQLDENNKAILEWVLTSVVFLDIFSHCLLLPRVLSDVLFNNFDLILRVKTFENNWMLKIRYCLGLNGDRNWLAKIAKRYYDYSVDPHIDEKSWQLLKLMKIPYETNNSDALAIIFKLYENPLLLTVVRLMIARNMIKDEELKWYDLVLPQDLNLFFLETEHHRNLYQSCLGVITSEKAITADKIHHCMERVEWHSFYTFGRLWDFIPVYKHKYPNRFQIIVDSFISANPNRAIHFLNSQRLTEVESFKTYVTYRLTVENVEFRFPSLKADHWLYFLSVVDVNNDHFSKELLNRVRFDTLFEDNVRLRSYSTSIMQANLLKILKSHPNYRLSILITQMEKLVPNNT
eukprot:NODE_115_length_19014_cov_0.489664.p3 type:complete len:528 gc:universal NODE_115_length_19014_cov_0.489664:17368-15785(-)